jgi:hypothetical protein
MMKALPLALLASLSVAACGRSASTSEPNPLVSERGTCIPGTHHPLRVRKSPGMAQFTEKKRDPLEDAYVHCPEPARKDRP